MSRKLTLEYISLRVKNAKIDQLDKLKTLNLWNNYLEDISVLSELPSLEIVSLSVNSIKTLEPFSKMKNLSELYLRKNLIDDINQINYLKNCSNLKVLSLIENPICSIEGYRDKILNILPQLTKLDDINVENSNKIGSKIEGKKENQIEDRPENKPEKNKIENKFENKIDNKVNTKSSNRSLKENLREMQISSSTFNCEENPFNNNYNNDFNSKENLISYFNENDNNQNIGVKQNNENLNKNQNFKADFEPFDAKINNFVKDQNNNDVKKINKNEDKNNIINKINKNVRTKKRFVGNPGRFIGVSQSVCLGNVNNGDSEFNNPQVNQPQYKKKIISKCSLGNNNQVKRDNSFDKIKNKNNFIQKKYMAANRYDEEPEENEEEEEDGDKTKPEDINKLETKYYNKDDFNDGIKNQFKSNNFTDTVTNSIKLLLTSLEKDSLLDIKNEIDKILLSK